MNVDREKEKLRDPILKWETKERIQIVFIFGTLTPSAVVTCTCQVCLPVYRQSQISMQIFKYKPTNKTPLHKNSNLLEHKKSCSEPLDRLLLKHSNGRKRSELKLHYSLQVRDIFHNLTNHLLTFLHTKQPATNDTAFRSAILVLVFTFYS